MGSDERNRRARAVLTTHYLTYSTEIVCFTKHLNVYFELLQQSLSLGPILEVPGALHGRNLKVLRVVSTVLCFDRSLEALLHHIQEGSKYLL